MTLTTPRRRHGLMLPASVHACLFDLDGVLTDTATIHAQAWKATFDDFLRARAEVDGSTFVPFDAVHDYGEYVDGKHRCDGVRSFLASRGIELPDADVGAIAARKNELVLTLIHRRGVVPFAGSVRLVRAARHAGLSCAVVSASANCREVLESADLAGLFDVRVDGVVAEREHLQGKPAPDTYLAAAELLRVTPGEGAVFEDSLAGIAAARAGHFGYIVGVDRVGQAEALRALGADVVVGDLAELVQ